MTTVLALRLFVIVAIVGGIGTALIAFVTHRLRSNPGISIQRGIPRDGSAHSNANLDW